MGEEERENVEFAKKLVGFFDDRRQISICTDPYFKRFQRKRLGRFRQCPLSRP